MSTLHRAPAAASVDECPPLDRAALAASLVDADLRVLLMCLFHVSDDRRWLAPPFRPTRVRGHQLTAFTV